MKQKCEEPVPQTICPRCGATTQAAIWPYLKGVLAGGVQLHWRRCQACQTLFSEITGISEITEINCGADEGRQPVHRDAQEGARPDQR